VTVVVLAVAMAMACALLWGALEKARSPRSFVSVLRQLGVPEGFAPVVAALVIATELGAALGLILAPSPVMLVAIACLATAFACSGWIALRRPEPIRCGCFGPNGGRELGKDQLAAFPLWLGGIALLWSNAPTLSAGARTAWLAPAVALTIAVIRMVACVLAARAAFGDRQSAREMLLWLSR
jgi:hypothetical protein